MVIEHVLLPVSADQRAAFVAALSEARPYIEASPGFIGVSLHCPVIDDGPLLLMVTWNSIADHRDGFRKSDGYQHWKALLHPFYSVLPEVCYYSESLC